MSPDPVYPIFHIGYHKTGTTFLQRKLFERHAKLRRVDRFVVNRTFIFPTELEYSENAAITLVEEQLSDGAQKGYTPVFSNERLSAGHHTGGYDSLVIARRIRKAAPDAKILITIREQRSMLISLYYQYVKAYGVLSLNEYIDPKHTTRNEVFHWSTLAYDCLISEYIKMFGKSSVLVLPYELLLQDSREFLVRVTRFCGLSQDDPAINRLSQERAVKRRKKPTSTELRRILNPFIRADIPHIGSTYYIKPVSWVLKSGIRLVDWLPIGLIDRRIEKKQERLAKTFVEDRYRESNSAVCELIDLNLRDYGYVCAD